MKTMASLGRSVGSMLDALETGYPGEAPRATDTQPE